MTSQYHFYIGCDFPGNIDKWVKLALEIGAEKLKLILLCNVSKGKCGGWRVACNDDHLYTPYVGLEICPIYAHTPYTCICL